MKKAISLIFAAVAMTAMCDTVAWWRFGDLGPDGGKATSETVFTNTVDASAYTAYPRSFDNQTAPATDPDYMPSATNAFGEYSTLQVYDPVSDTSHAMATALHCPWGGDGSGRSGGAVVPIEPELCGITNGVQGDFTFECFFKTTSEGLNRSQSMEPIAGVPKGSLGAWSLVIYNKHIWCRCTQEKIAGGTEAKNSDNTQGVTITPDEWHHAAIVYSRSAQIFTVYLDYAASSSVAFPADTFTGKIAFDDNKYLYLGKGTYQSDRSFDGEIAEARFSNAALGPSTFLQLREKCNADRASSDPDTIAWFSIDKLDYGSSFLAANPKVCRTDSLTMFGTVVMRSADTAAAIDTVTPGLDGIVRGAVTGEYGRVTVNNAASALFVKNTDTNWYFSVVDPSKRIGGGSFTAEAFFKTAHPIETGNGVFARSYGIMESKAFKFMINQATGCLFFRPSSADGVDYGRDYSSARVDDGTWHHLALVYDYDLLSLKIYLDNTCIKTFDDFTFSAGNLGSAIAVGSAPTSSQDFDGWIDEVRFTGRALSAVEFLTTAPAVADDMLVRIPFDGNSQLLPYGFAGTAAAYICNTNGVATPPEALSKGRSPYVMTGSDRSTRIENNGAYRFDGGSLSYPHIEAIERPNITIEFFWRPFDVAAPWPTPLGLAGTDTAGNVNVDSPGTGMWVFFYDGAWTYSQLMFKFAYMDGSERKVANKVAVSPQYSFGAQHQIGNTRWAEAPFDGNWHHVAVTIEEYEDGGETHTKATTYFDYKKKGSVDVVGTLATTGKSALMMQKASSSADRLCCWDIDEVRITGKVLSPEQFCRKAGKGIFIIFE